jgi:hypothetical protein
MKTNTISVISVRIRFVFIPTCDQGEKALLLANKRPKFPKKKKTAHKDGPTLFHFAPRKQLRKSNLPSLIEKQFSRPSGSHPE